MSPPPPPVFPIFLTPPAKESFPVVQSAHEHLRHASDTIHQHRYSLASQLKGFDSRWAHLFSVAPVLNKLTKGRQRPDEFRKNAQGLDDDVQVALEEARKRKYSQTRFADEQDSIIPGPPPSDTIYSKVSRKVKALSSILERVERGDQVQPGASRTSRSPHVSSKTSSQSKHRAKSPTKSPSEQSKARPSKLTPKRSSRDRLRTTSGREGERERDRDRERDLGRDRDYRHREDRDRYRDRNRNRDRDSRDRDNRDRDRERDRNNRDRDRERGRNSREREASRERTRDTRRSPRSSSRHDHYHRYSPEGKTHSPGSLGNVGQPPVPAPPHPVLSAPPAPVIPSNIPPIYARFANGHKYEYDNNADLEPLQPPVLPFVTERMERRREAKEQNGRSPQDQNPDYRRGQPPPSSYPLPTSSYHPQNPQIIPPSDGRGRGRDRSNRSAHRRAGYNGYDNYTYSSTSTPVIPVMATLPNSSSDPINTNIVIPAPSSTRHLSRSRYPPPSSKASRSPYLHTREEYGYKNDHGYNGYNGYNDYNGYGRDGRTGAEYQGDDGHRYEPNSNVRNGRSSRSPRTHYPPSPQPTRNPRSPKSPLIMRSKFKENFSVLQSESGR
ncbi:hypothetical protein HHX47_DHR8000221 [Lentinula edodes]|nr:hypothetical protein HHX47_DHR8000221 [Lentinula edodes]